MNIIEKSNDFLRILSIKSNHDVKNEISAEKIRKLLNINKRDFLSIIHFLKEKNSISLLNDDYDIRITALGIENVYELKKNKKFIVIKFLKTEQMPVSRDGYDFMYYYTLTEDNKSINHNFKIKIGISGTLLAIWNNQIPNRLIYNIKILEKILFRYAINNIINKIENGILNEYEELTMLSDEYAECMFKNLDDLIDPENSIYEIEIFKNKKKNEPLVKNEIGNLILEKRDIINARFNSLFGIKLFTITQERDLLNLLKDSNTEEEFIHRILSLSNMIQCLNNQGLKNLIEINSKTDKTDKSINLFEKFFIDRKINISDNVKLYRSIIDLRNGFPIHTDSDKKGRLLNSYKYLGLEFPIKNYNNSWKILLSRYLTSLDKLDEILSKELN